MMAASNWRWAAFALRIALVAFALALLDKAAEEAARRSALASASIEGALSETDCSISEAAIFDLLAWNARVEVVALKADADLALAAMILSSLAEALILFPDSVAATIWDTLSSGDVAGIAREETNRCCR